MIEQEKKKVEKNILHLNFNESQSNEREKKHIHKTVFYHRMYV